MFLLVDQSGEQACNFCLDLIAGGRDKPVERLELGCSDCCSSRRFDYFHGVASWLASSSCYWKLLERQGRSDTACLTPLKGISHIRLDCQRDTKATRICIRSTKYTQY